MLVWQPTGLTSADAGSEFAVPQDSVILAASGRGSEKKRWLILTLILLAVLPFLLQVFKLSGLTILRTIGIYILLTLGLNLALGTAGLLDFGFALSYGVGAYTTAILGQSIGFLPAVLCGIFIASLTGMIKGGLGWRLHGDYLAVATLSLGMLGSKVIVNLKATGGAGGLAG